MTAPVHLLVGIVFRDAAETLAAAMDSVIDQVGHGFRTTILLVNDGSTDTWRSVLSGRLDLPNVRLREVAFRSVARARNFVLDEVDANFPDVDYVSRLDADDVLATPNVLAELAALLLRERPDVVIAGNLQRRDGAILPRPNRATVDLLEPARLLERLDRMATGDSAAELPSCNTVVRRGVAVRYPIVPSAEDHWFTTTLLLSRRALRVVVAPELIYSIYRLHGPTTTTNATGTTYLRSRRQLESFARERIADLADPRVERARSLLRDFRNGEYAYLGAGFAGVVFHDAKWVYKVHIPIGGGPLGESAHLPYLASRLDAFRGAEHLYQLRELVLHEGTYILVYPYEPSEPVVEASEAEWCSYLAETWERRLIVRSVKLSTNFRRVDGVLKLVDYEVEPYDDNLFLNAALRAFIQLPAVRARSANFSKLQRASINGIDHLPELAGFFGFISRVGDTIGFRARRRVWQRRRKPASTTAMRLEHEGALERWLIAERRDFSASLPLDSVDLRRISLMALRHGFRSRGGRVEAPPASAHLDEELRVRLDFQRLNDPPQPVSLIIKACAQDLDLLESATKHVVSGLSGPERFAERMLALDVSPRPHYLRQFASGGSVDQLLEVAQRLIDEGVIDRIVTSPLDDADVRAVNRSWFSVDSAHTHTRQGVPVAPQLYAFDAARTDAILQVDIDALIGVRDPKHPVLADMLRVFDDPRVISVAYPICRPAGEEFQPYFGFDNGGFVPEVRCCLLLRSRLRALCPLPNEVAPDGLARSWYRAVEARQRETGTCSVRGGPGARFFIHPQNYRKTAPTTWPALIDRVESSAVPVDQVGQPEVRGAFADWGIPARTEEIVVVVVMTDETATQACRLLVDLEAQSCESFGVLLVDASGRRRASWIGSSLGFDASRLTTVDHHVPLPKAGAALKAIRSFVRRDDAMVCLVDASDVLLGARVIEDMRTKMRAYDADVLIGKELSAERLRHIGKHPHDLVEPRRSPMGCSDGIRVVRRYLLDALDIQDVQVARPRGADANTFARLSASHAWVEDDDLLSLVVPAVSHQRHRDDAAAGGREPRRFRGGIDERATEDHG